MERPFVAVARGRQLGEGVSLYLPPQPALLFHCKAMTNDIADALARIDRALTRIETASTLARAPSSLSESGSESGSESASDGRYQRLRTRTQAALAELDTVIARVAKTERG